MSTIPTTSPRTDANLGESTLQNRLKQLTVKSKHRGIDLLLHSSGKSLVVNLFKGTTSLAFRSGAITQSRIHLEGNKACLWVDGAAFDVPVNQVSAIASAFGIEITDY